MIFNSLKLIFLIIGCIKSQSIYNSINQTKNVVELFLSKPLYLFNITNLDYLYSDTILNELSILNSCIFKTDYFTLNLTNLKGSQNSFEYINQYDDFYFSFSFCSDYPSVCNAGYQSCITDSYYYPKSAYSTPTGDANSETFQIGKLGIDDFALKLTYKTRGNKISNYYFVCDDTEEFEYKPRTHSKDFYSGIIDIDIVSKYVCPYKNTKKSPISNYSLIQPNILRFTLDKSSTTTFSFNNGYFAKTLPIKPIVYSCKNDGDIITVDGLFFVDNMKSNYTFNFGSGYSLPSSSIITFNSTTLVLNSTGFVDDNFFISLDGIQSDMYPILKPQQKITMTYIYTENNMLNINCSNCIGAILKGLNYTYTTDELTINNDMKLSINLDYCKFVQDTIYLEAPISPYKRSDILSLPKPNVSIMDNNVFSFNGTSVVKMNGYFIPKKYNNQIYIKGKLQFSNGTIFNLNYNTSSDMVNTNGIFNIPIGFGNGTLIIYVDNSYTIYSGSFSYQAPTNNWVTSLNQNLNKVELQLSFPHLFFPISSIKYNNKNGTELDYQLIEPNIIIYTIYSDSGIVLSFNNDFHVEILSNGSQYRPVIYSYTIENGAITMDGLFISNSMPNYRFYDGNIQNPISSGDVLYFNNSKISINKVPDTYLIVYSDSNSFTLVPDIKITSDKDNLIFSCNNCFGGYINVGTNPKNNPDSNFSKIGKIVKQYNRKNISFDNVYTFNKGIQSIVLDPPSPTNLEGIESFYEFSTFSNNTISISGNFLYDNYNQKSYTSFVFTNYEGYYTKPDVKIIQNSDQSYKYLIDAKYYSYESGNFSIYFPFVNGSLMLLKSIPIKFPKRPIVYSFSTINNNELEINGDGFYDTDVVGAFKRINPNYTYYEPIDSDINKCLIRTLSNTYIRCYFNIDTSQYNSNAAISFQLKNTYGPLEPVYFQTYFGSDSPNSDISLHSIISIFILTLTIVITILIQ